MSPNKNRFAVAGAILATNVAHPALAQEATNKSVDAFKPIHLKCPAENAGELEVIRKALDGVLTKTVGTYQGDRLVHLNLSVAAPSGKFVPTLEGAPSDKPNSKIGDLLRKAAEQTQKLKVVVCDTADPTIRGRYNVILEKNRLERLNAGQQ